MYQRIRFFHPHLVKSKHETKEWEFDYYLYTVCNYLDVYLTHVYLFFNEYQYRCIDVSQQVDSHTFQNSKIFILNELLPGTK